MKSFFSSSLDLKVFLSIGILLFFSALFLSYQYTQHVDCENARFIVYAKDYSANKTLEFYDNTPGAKSWQWDFGDSTSIDTRQRTLHSYKKAGDYIVKLTLNKNCLHEKLITIVSASRQGDLPLIISPDIVIAGETIKFNGIKKDGISWEWNFGESFKTDALNQAPLYRFTSPGRKKITLVVNGDLEHSASKTIYVAPQSKKEVPTIGISSYEFEKPHSTFSLPIGKAQKDPMVEVLEYIPVSPKSAVRKDTLISHNKEHEISNEQFTLLLKQIAAESKTKDDLNVYLCGKYDIPIVINKKRIVSFEEFCQLIAGKKIKIISLRMDKNQQNCIERINIQYKVKKFMIWIKE